MKYNSVLVIIAGLFFLSPVGCIPVSQHQAQVRDTSTNRVTVGTVQRAVKIGMSGARVMELLGSPNIVTTDEKRREVWVYDKFSTESAFSTSSGGVRMLVLGGAAGGSGAVGGGVGTGFGQSTGAVSTSQRTLTVIIKFDHNNRVRDFAYRQSSF